MDDPSNWEFAASIAAVCIGLGGLLLFTLIGTIGGWRVFSRASQAANEAAKAAIAVQDLARQLALHAAVQPGVVDLTQAASQLSGLGAQADALLEQQTRLQAAVRNLVEAGVLRGEGAAGTAQLESALSRIEEQLVRIMANLGQRQT